MKKLLLAQALLSLILSNNLKAEPRRIEKARYPFLTVKCYSEGCQPETLKKAIKSINNQFQRTVLVYGESVKGGENGLFRKGIIPTYVFSKKSLLCSYEEIICFNPESIKEVSVIQAALLNYLERFYL